MAKKTLPPIQISETAKKLLQEGEYIKESAIENGDIIDPEVQAKYEGDRPESALGIEKNYDYLPGDFYDKYEDYINPHTLHGRSLSVDEMKQLRFENQTLGQEIGHAAGRIATNIIPSVIGGFASMVDIPGYFSAEEAANNTIVNWADDWKKRTDEEWLPIHTDPKGDTLDLTSSAWWASRGSGLVESVLSFVVQGAGVGKGVSLLGKGLGSLTKGKTLFNALSKVPGATSGAEVYAGLAKGTQTLTTAAMLNQSEAVIEATQVYKDTYDSRLAKGYSVEEAKQSASDAAATTMSLNRINILLNLSSAGAFLKPFKGSRNLLKEVTKAGAVKEVVKEGGQEALEEAINHIASQAGKATGEGKEYTWENFKKDISSGEAMEAMFLGALGGVGQTAVTNLTKGKQRKQEREEYETQQKIINEMKEQGVRMSDALMNIAEKKVYNDKLTKAIESGNEAEVEKLKTQMFENEAVKAFESGTTKVLEGLYKAEAARDPEEVGQEYIDNANNALKRIKELESIYNNFEQYENRNDIFNNRVAEQRNQIALKHISEAKRVNEITLGEEVRNIAEKHKFKIENDAVIRKDGKETTERISREVPLTYSLTTIENNPEVDPHNKEIYNKFLNEVQQLPSYEAHKKYEEDSEIVKEKLSTIEKEFKDLKSPKAQEKAAKEKAKKEKKKQAIIGLTKNDSISDIEKLKEELEDEEFNALANARIKKINEAKTQSDNEKKHAKVEKEFVAKLDRATLETIESFYDEIDKLEIPDKNKENLRKAYERRVAILNGEEVPNDNPFAGFEHGEPDESDFAQKKDDVDTNSVDPRDPSQEKKDVEKEVSEIAEEILKNKTTLVGKDSQGGLIYNYIRSTIGAIRAAFLSRNYLQTENKTQVDREEITNDVQNLYLLDPDNVKEGTKVNLSVQTDYTGKKYTSSTEKETIEWLDRLAQLKERYPDNWRQSSEYIAEVPIIATDENGRELFYLHDIKWINDSNLDLSEEELKQERSKLFNMRRHIVFGGTTESSITFRGNGHLMITHDKQNISLGEAMPDTNLPLAVAHDELTGNKTFRGLKNVKNDSIQKGRLYAVVPIGNTHVPIPLGRKEIDQRTIDTIMVAVKAWLDPKKHKEIVQEISRTMGIDITNTSGLEKYLNHFIYLTKTQGISGLAPFINPMPTAGGKLKSSHKLIGVTGNSLQYGMPGKNLIIPGEKGKPEKVKELSPNFKPSAEQLAHLETFLQGLLSNASSDSIYTNGDVILFDSEGTPSSPQSYESFLKETHETNVLGINVGSVEKPKYVYTIQPTILIDDSFVESVPVKKEIKPVSNLEERKKELKEKYENQIANIDPEEVRKRRGISQFGHSLLLRAIDEIKADFKKQYEKALKELENRESESIEQDVAESVTAEINNTTIEIAQEEVEESYTDEDFDTSDLDNDEEFYDDIDELPKTIDEQQLKAIKDENDKLFVKHISTSTQESLVSYLASKIIQASIEAEKVNKKKADVDIAEVLEKEKDLLRQARDKQKKLGNDKNANRIHSVIEQWGKVTSLTKSHLALYTSGSVYGSIEENSDNTEEVFYDDSKSFTVSSKNTASANLKKFFSYVPHVNAEGKQTYNILGLPQVVPFDEVYDTIHQVLANKPADYKTMIAHLDLETTTFPWLRTVIKNLEEAGEDIKNEFVSDMTKHYIDMKFVMWSKDSNGHYMVQLWDSDNTNKAQVLRQNWNNNIRENVKPGSLLTLDGNSDYVFDKNTIARINQLAEEFAKEIPSKDEIGFRKLSEFLDYFGIIITDRTYEDLAKGRLKNKKLLSWQQLFTNEAGIIKPLLKTLNSQSDSVFEDVNLLSDTIVKRLAELDAKNITNVFSNSYRAGIKTIYSYSNNKYLSNRARDLAQTDSEGKLVNQDLIDKLLKISFTKDSLWLNNLNKEGAEGDLMRSIFEMNYVSLEALKKQNSASKDNRKLNNMTDAEHEVIKLGMFFNSSKNPVDGEFKRVVNFFYPTLSDKSTMVTIQTLAEQFKWNSTTKKITEKGLKTLYKTIVEPEILRMSTSTAREGYKPDYFYFIPSLNEKELTIGDTTKTIREWVIDKKTHHPEVQEVIFSEIESVYEKLVEDKLKIWKKLGIGEFKKGAVSLIDKSYLKEVAEGIGAEKVRFAAMDFVYNSLIANAEMYKIGPGDPAQYYKKSSKEGATIQDHILETYVNIGKRLAGEIAPGVELADSKNNKYIQVCFEDQPIDSLNVQNKEVLAYMRKIIPNFGDRKVYAGIEGSDAQEYTTWREHLYVMKQMGKLTEKQFKDFTSRLEKKEELTYEELGHVLQPMKPVYNGNIVDVENNIDRKIYIKSSSFPLLPQLTAGMEIDKIRETLEDFERNDKEGRTVRASFGTANKIGAKKAMKVFNKDGTVVDKMSISDDNMLVLERKNFRIQQEVPYKVEKNEVNIGTQARKLLFVNMLDVEIEPGVTGKDLQEMYDNAYANLFQHKYYKLMDRFGLVETIATENVSQLYELPTENSIFDKLKVRDEQLQKASNAISKSKIKNEFEAQEGSLNTKRADYINENFDKIVKAFAEAKVNIFFEEGKEEFDKNCE